MQHVTGHVIEFWGWVMGNLLIINIIFSIIIVFFRRKDPRTVWTWLLAINCIPIFGFVLYLLLCQDFKKSKMFRVKGVMDRLSYSAKNQERFMLTHEHYIHDPLNRDYGDLMIYNLETEGAVLTVDNKIDIFTDGEEKFSDLREELKKATRFIHMQYYIIKNDEVFNSIIPILVQKSKEGVEVRILFDGMGGRFMPEKVWRRLREAGIKVGEFFPAFLGRLHFRINYRNHRKIVVIDGKIGYVGGFNIGKEYISKDPKFGYWRDTHLKLQGSSVISLQIRFALDWNYATKENLFKDIKYFEPFDRELMTAEKWIGMQILSGKEYPLGIQIVASGPDSGRREIRNNYLQLFHKAKKNIYIQTPYFIPDDAILTALSIAAKSGVDVKLMIPCKPDHPFVYWANSSYVGDLLEAGAHCYTYDNGFLHAKGVMVDGRVSCYGTANMDIRSFELNFEVNAVIYDDDTTEELEEIFKKDLEKCTEITLEQYRNRSLGIRIKEQVSRLISPLL